MAKFKYRMQNILNIKLKLEEQAKMEYSQSNTRLMQEEKQLRYIQKRKQDYEEAGQKLRSSKLNVLDLKENNAAIRTLREEMTAQEKKVALAQKDLERAREHLKESMQERKTQEKLYENAFDAFVKEENARESKQVDELTSYTYGQKKQMERRVEKSGDESWQTGRI